MNEKLVDPELQTAIEQLLGSYGWLILIAFLGILFKDAIHKAAEGLLVCVGKDFCNDDVLYISGRQARIVRVGFLKTIFYMTDRGTKMIVPNDRLKLLVIEKKLPLNGGFSYLYKGGEQGFEQQKAIREKMKELPELPKDK
tara:strand:- start:768 stop:1190 length:423 start_codon:yes stop_codon:yes gene_type:complete